MTNNDHEHLAFEAHCEEANLDNRQHPLHLLYLEGDTQRALTHFKAGYEAGKEQTTSNSALSGVLWRTIDTAPKDNSKKINYILIAHGPCLADLVIWRAERPERVVNGNKHLAIPEGWFVVNGSRSRILDPTHWMPLPDAP